MKKKNQKKKRTSRANKRRGFWITITICNAKQWKNWAAATITADKKIEKEKEFKMKKEVQRTKSQSKSNNKNNIYTAQLKAVKLTMTTVVVVVVENDNIKNQDELEGDVVKTMTSLT